MSISLAHKLSANLVFRSVTRADFLAAAATLALVNGLTGKIMTSVNREGWTTAALGTFDVSLVVLVASFVGLKLLWSARGTGALGAIDLGLGGLTAIFAVAPFAPLSWLALTALAVRTIRSGLAGSSIRRAGWILLSVAGSFFWTKMLFSLFAPTILSGDAMLAAVLLGAEQSGNMVQFADGSGYFQVYPACSSLGNLSVGLVCWVTAVNLHAPGRTSQNLLVALGISAAVVAINVTRLALIGFFPTYFDLIHGPVGASAAEWATLLTVVGMSAYGVRQRQVLA